MNVARKAWLRTVALMLRYKTTKPTFKSQKYVQYKQVADALNLTYNEVQHICRAALRPKRPLTSRKMIRKLNDQHVQFLISPLTLEHWAGLTMKQRTVYFHRKFTDKRIAVTSLRRLYHKHGIKRKKVRQEKVMPKNVRIDFVSKCQTVLEELTQARNEGRLVIFLDEINFSKRSLALCEYSGKNTNLSVDQKEVYTGYRSVIACMTEEEGIGFC